jgi:hypothetical protein
VTRLSPRCGFEGLLLRKRLYERCTLTDKLTTALDDGTGRIHPLLGPLLDVLRSMDKPESGLSWVTKLAVRDLLHDLASGRVALTHEAFQQLPSKRTATYLRDLLMQCGVLPTVDRQLLLFERWLTEHIATIENAERARLLQHFATWHPLRRLRAKTEAR